MFRFFNSNRMNSSGLSEKFILHIIDSFQR